MEIVYFTQNIIHGFIKFIRYPNILGINGFFLRITKLDQNIQNNYDGSTVYMAIVI